MSDKAKNALLAALGLALALVLWRDAIFSAGAAVIGYAAENLMLVLSAAAALLLMLLSGAIIEGAPGALSEARRFFARHGYSTYLLVAAPAAAAAVYWTFTSDVLMGLSGFAAAAANICLFVAAYALFDKLPFRRVDTYGEIERGNMAVAVYCGCVALGMALLIVAATG